MDTNHDEEVTGTVGDLVLRAMSDPKTGPAFTQAYLRAGFLSSSVDCLFQARRRAGLTQEDVARRLGTKQPAIARWEADTEGSISLRRYVDLALASDAVPLILLASKDDVLEFIHANPSAPRTADAYLTWRHRSSEAMKPEKWRKFMSGTRKSASVFPGARYSALFTADPEESGRMGVPSPWNVIASQPLFNSSVSISGTTGSPSPVSISGATGNPSPVSISGATGNPLATIMQGEDETDRELAFAEPS